MSAIRRPALRKARELAGLSERALAQRIGISKGFVSKVEVGLRSPTLAVMERWLTALGPQSLDLFRLEAGEDDAAGQPQTKANLPEVA